VFRAGEPRTIGVIGLGAGTLAVYGTERDHLRFFEIDPAVAYCAREFFTFLRQSPAATSTVLGDARRQLARERDGSFDVLVVDAFSGDAIPVHLITTEAVALYLSKLKPGGLLLLHISSFHFDLRSVVYSIAARMHLHALHLVQDSQLHPGEEANYWMLLTTDPEFLRHDEIASAVRPPPAGIDKFPPWTDQFSNLLGIVWD
jgi:spermidine synthase